VKAKLPLWERIFDCDTCGAVLDRDVNAARNIAREAARLLGLDHDEDQPDGAGLRPESGNAAPRPRKASYAQAERAGSLEGGTKHPSPRMVAA
jgi:putative transposase